MPHRVLDFASLPLRRTLGVVALLAGFLTTASAQAGTIDWVTVGDPGNLADTTGNPNPAGAVADPFRIMKYEFTNQQYADFLNSAAQTDPYSLYNASMGTDARGGITQSGASGSYTYAVKSNMGDKPVNFVNWFDAARVANWLMNGATSASSTETGAYTLGGATSGTAPAVNPGATFYIPTQDQWYKAAFYKGGGTNAGYWDYATQSDTAPTPVSADSTGNGSAGSTGNSANYNLTANWNGQTQGFLTTVGTNGGPSFYGAFDMSGNVFEWNDLTGAAGTLRGRRGGYYGGNFSTMMSSEGVISYTASIQTAAGGFRLASAVAAGVPEIDPAGMGSVLALVTGGLALIERRRLKVA